MYNIFFVIFSKYNQIILLFLRLHIPKYKNISYYLEYKTHFFYKEWEYLGKGTLSDETKYSIKQELDVGEHC